MIYLQTIQLQGIGIIPAIPVSQLKKGDRVVFNYGEVQIVEDIQQTSKSSFTIIWRYGKAGELAKRTKRGTTLVAKI